MNLFFYLFYFFIIKAHPISIDYDKKNNQITKYNSYYKQIYYQGINGCVETNTTYEKAIKYNAKLGYCQDINCHHFKGNIYIPLLGIVKGYAC